MKPVRARLGILVTTAAVLAIGVSTASASQIISTTGVSDLTLGVNTKGEAMLTYTVARQDRPRARLGCRATRSPRPGGQQVAFKLAYDGGYKKYYTENPTVQRRLNTLRLIQSQERLEMGGQRQSSSATPWATRIGGHLRDARTAPQRRRELLADLHLPDLRRAGALPTSSRPAQAPDGSYWAVQSWDRDLPDYGVGADHRPVPDGESTWRTGPARFPPSPCTPTGHTADSGTTSGAPTPTTAPASTASARRRGPRSTASAATSTSTPRLRLRPRLAAGEQLPHAQAGRLVVLRLSRSS